MGEADFFEGHGFSRCNFELCTAVGADRFQGMWILLLVEAACSEELQAVVGVAVFRGRRILRWQNQNRLHQQRKGTCCCRWWWRHLPSN